MIKNKIKNILKLEAETWLLKAFTSGFLGNLVAPCSTSLRGHLPVATVQPWETLKSPHPRMMRKCSLLNIILTAHAHQGDILVTCLYSLLKWVCQTYRFDSKHSLSLSSPQFFIFVSMFRFLFEFDCGPRHGQHHLWSWVSWGLFKSNCAHGLLDINIVIANPTFIILLLDRSFCLKAQSQPIVFLNADLNVRQWASIRFLWVVSMPNRESISWACSVPRVAVWTSGAASESLLSWWREI